MATVKGLFRYSVQEAQNAALGQAGVVFIDGDAAQDEITGPFVAITALSDAAVDVSQCDMSYITSVADFTIPKGVTMEEQHNAYNGIKK
jgi:hypothetical protein